MVVLLLPLVAAILLYDRFSPPAPFPENQRDYAFVITSGPRSTTKCERFETKLIAQRDSGTWEKAKGKVYLYLLRDSANTMPSYGDTIIAHTSIEPTHQVRRAFAARYTLSPAPDHTVPLQVRLYNRLSAAGLEGDELAVVGALTLGYKDDIDPELRHRFQASGAAHVLAVSGLHTGILYVLILWLLTLGGRIKPRYENQIGRCLISGVIIAVMWGYAWLTGMTPSVVRAVLMVTLVEIGKMIYRKSFSINTIAAAAVLILLVRPYDLWSVSFQLSFAATASIVLFANALGSTIKYRSLKKTFWGKILNWFIGIILVSLAAQLGTMPITMFHFGQVSTYFLLTNLLVLPLATLLVPSGLLSIAFGGSGIGWLVGKVTSGLAWLMNHAVGWIESLPGSTVSAQVNGPMIVVYYALLLCFLVFVLRKRT